MKKDKTLRLSNFLKEGLEDLETNLPTQVDKFLEKLIQQLRSYNMNRSKKALIIAKIIDGLGMDKQQVMQSIQKIKQSGALAENQNNKSTKLKSLIKPSLNEAKKANRINLESIGLTEHSIDFNIDDVIKECDKLKVFLQKRKKAGDTFARVSSKSYRDQTIYTMNTSVDN